MFYQYVIVGGGAGGVELAARLGRQFGKEGRNKVLLIDRSVFHIWKPTLHEVAVGTLNPQQEGLSYSILARRNHFSFTVGHLIGLDAENKQLTLAEVYTDDQDHDLITPERTISFERCVLAVGSGSNFFNTKGAAEHAYVLENAQDAQHFQRHLLDLFAKAAYSPQKSLKVVIIGGGATGVELSAELTEAYHEILQSFGTAQRFDIDINLIESAPRILAGLPETVSAQATLALQQKGIQVFTGRRAEEIGRDFVQTDQARLEADVVVWAAGIKAADNNQSFGLPVNRINQFEVNAQLQTPADGVYAMGDCAACKWENDKLLPARAQVASQQAAYLCRLLKAHDTKSTFSDAFVYKDSGSLVSLGDNKGVGNLMGSLSGKSFFIEGLVAKWMYMSLHLMHHRAILGTPKTVLLAFARLAQRRVSGRLKLH